MFKTIKQFSLGVMLGALVFITFGCGRGNTAMNKAVFGKPGSVALAWKSETASAIFNRTGAQGFLEYVFTEASTGSLPDRLKTLEVAPSADKNFLQKYGQAFESKGIKTTAIKLALDKKQLKIPSAAAGIKLSPYDFRSYKTTLNVDYVAFLDVEFFGSEQTYFSIFPTSGPDGLSKIHVYLIDTATNAVIAEHHSQKKIPLSGKNNEQNDYQGTREAVVKALETTLEDAYNAFFKK